MGCGVDPVERCQALHACLPACTSSSAGGRLPADLPPCCRQAAIPAAPMALQPASQLASRAVASAPRVSRPAGQASPQDVWGEVGIGGGSEASGHHFDHGHDHRRQGDLG